jgi:hypothetical protein
MTTIRDRIALLERTIAAAMQKRPMPFYVLPAEDDTHRADIQAKIAERTKAGQPFFTYEIV